MPAEVDELFERLVGEYRMHNPDEGTRQIEQAYHFALRAHQGQKRETGEPYIVHPLNVALICAQLNMDRDSIVSALLHDTVEDTPVRLRKISRVFGGEIAGRVEALTKIKRIDLFARFTGRTMSDEQARNLQKLFVAMASDFRVLVIKLADRLHNLRTMAALTADRAVRSAKETLDFYAPLARRLGLSELAHEMEDISFGLLHPKDYQWVRRELERTVGRKTAAYDLMKDAIEAALKREGLQIQRIFGRIKTPYSTWRKMKEQNLPLDQVFDLIAVRIVIRGDEIDCYRALGIVHGLYRPLTNRFRDFIAAPKSNGYQSLHTTVAGEQGQIAEVQIRTAWMDDVAEHGVAAHWKYKGHDSQYHLRETFSWFKLIEDLYEQHLDSRDFVEKTRESLTYSEVLVLSPQGEVVSLPEGSTVLDFAYYIHTELGHSARHALVNGVDAPLDYKLQNGDMVQIIKNEEGTPAPQPEWLNMVKSPKSIAKIKRWFRSRSRRERVRMGRFLLRQQIVKSGLYPLNLMDNTKLLQLIRALRIRKIDDLFDQIATGGLMADEVAQKLKQLHIEKALKPPTAVPGEPELHFHSASGLAGELGIARRTGKPLRRKVELMPCCTPVPGDDIFGVDNRSEHRVEVHHALCARGGEDAQLIIPVEWADGSLAEYYPAALRIVALNRVGLFFDVLRELSELSINLIGGSLNLQPSVAHQPESAVLHVVVEVHDEKQLREVIAAVSGVEDVFGVARVYERLEEK